MSFLWIYAIFTDHSRLLLWKSGEKWTWLQLYITFYFYKVNNNKADPGSLPSLLIIATACCKNRKRDYLRENYYYFWEKHCSLLSLPCTHTCECVCVLRVCLWYVWPCMCAPVRIPLSVNLDVSLWCICAHDCVHMSLSVFVSTYRHAGGGHTPSQMSFREAIHLVLWDRGSSSKWGLWIKLGSTSQ